MQVKNTVSFTQILHGHIKTPQRARRHLDIIRPCDAKNLWGCERWSGGVAADNCVLFMWATFPTIKDALALIDAWGFTYKTIAFTWIKENRKSGGLFWGLGNWTRSNAEVCLLATKGKPKRISAGVHSVILSPVGRHSEKPAEVRERIVKLCGDVPRIELFARQEAEGWDCWGNEV